MHFSKMSVTSLLHQRFVHQLKAYRVPLMAKQNKTSKINYSTDNNNNRAKESVGTIILTM